MTQMGRVAKLSVNFEALSQPRSFNVGLGGQGVLGSTRPDLRHELGQLARGAGWNVGFARLADLSDGPVGRWTAAYRVSECVQKGSTERV